eukprot:Colp12_sorted_trinity150504_noHs@14510
MSHPYLPPTLRELLSGKLPEWLKYCWIAAGVSTALACIVIARIIYQISKLERSSLRRNTIRILSLMPAMSLAALIPLLNPRLAVLYEGITETYAGFILCAIYLFITRHFPDEHSAVASLSRGRPKIHSATAPFCWLKLCMKPRVFDEEMLRSCRKRIWQSPYVAGICAIMNTSIFLVSIDVEGNALNSTVQSVLQVVGALSFIIALHASSTLAAAAVAVLPEAGLKARFRLLRALIGLNQIQKLIFNILARVGVFTEDALFVASDKACLLRLTVVCCEVTVAALIALRLFSPKNITAEREPLLSERASGTSIHEVDV